MQGNKIFSVDKFLGLNESADGDTELKLGEASRIENFCITDKYNLKTRPGIRRYFPKHNKPDFVFNALGAEQFWTGYISGQKCFLYWGHDEEDFSFHAYFPDAGRVDTLNIAGADTISVLQIGTDVFAISFVESLAKITVARIFINDSSVTPTIAFDYKFNPYFPLVRGNCKPDGGGEDMEPLNILTNTFRVHFVSDGEATEYKLPGMTSFVLEVHIDGVRYDKDSVGEFSAAEHKFTFKEKQKKDAEVVFVCAVNYLELSDARRRFGLMRHYEYFNGDTDTRIFFYGDGTNVCYYTGHPAFADSYGYSSILSNESMEGDGTHANPSLYVPAGNEIAVDFSDSEITAMVRHYSRLLVFKPDGTAAITYEPVTLDDGKVIAGFYMRPVSREFGNEAPGQVELINNYPRSFTHGSIYEWRLTSYRDERYAKCVSQNVAKTLAAADHRKIVTCDDGINKTYYVFLNDEEGTVLINRYDLEVWSIYKSQLTRFVKQCDVFDGDVVFLRDDGNNKVLYFFDDECTYDYEAETTQDGFEETQIPIEAVWESGFMDFGAPHKKKFSSKLWISMQPESGSEMNVTVKTDKRGDYTEKTIGYSFLDFSCLDFSNFSFLTYAAPKVRRVLLKVKKFVYYKLIFRVTKPGAKATVLGYEQQVRYSSDVK